MADFSTAPWTNEEVENLSAWQNARWVHPFTCGNRSSRTELHGQDPEGDHGVLVPTNDGWVCRWCDYTQDWCHTFMLNGPGKDWFSEIARKTEQ